MVTMTSLNLDIHLLIVIYMCMYKTQRREGNVLFNDTLNTFYLPYGV